MEFDFVRQLNPITQKQIDVHANRYRKPLQKATTPAYL
jgi:hypothetical protein